MTEEQNRYEMVQLAAATRNQTQLNTEQLARQIVAAARGDQRVAYDFMDTLNRHVTLILQGKK
jgi:hypothetical protein